MLPRGAGSGREEIGPGRRARQERGGLEEPAGQRPDRSLRASVSPARPGARLPCPAPPPERRPCRRCPFGATSKCPPIPWVTDAFAAGSESRLRPAARSARDSPSGHERAAPASVVGAAGVGLPAAPRMLPCFQGDARHVNDVCLHGNQKVKKKREAGWEAAVGFWYLS